jgi:uncharacterized repeat protein (TIGR03806 family)
MHRQLVHRSRKASHDLCRTSLAFVSLALVSAGLSTHAAEPPAAAPQVFECRWIDSPIKIDGKADEPAWKTAQVIDQFSVPWLGKNSRPARTATRARLLWDRERLYFFAEMDDADLYADVTEHDGQTWDNDVFELFFKPAEDKPGYYEFQVNAANTKMDMFIPQRGSGGYLRYRRDGDFHIEAKVERRGTLNNWHDKDTGWSVEGSIPWTDFLRTGGRPTVDERWKFALCRYDYSVDFEGPDLSTCAPLSKPNFHLHEDYATLRFVGPNSTTAGLPYGVEKRVPLTTSRVVGSPEPPLPYRVRRAFPDLKVNFPIYVTNEPGSDRLLLITQGRSYGQANLVRTKDAADTDSFEQLLTFDGVAYDIAFHPDFAKNGFMYIGDNGPFKATRGAKKTRVTRYTLDRKAPYTIIPGSEKLIIEWLSDGHNGGALDFGTDGLLYISSGDGTSDSDTDVVGQDMTLLTAKVLRIDVDHPDADRAYSVPKDNPFVGEKDVRPETWAYGFRNPWRLKIDPKTNHLWVGNNGQDIWEQIFFVRPRDNFGWSVMEGSHPFYLTRKLGPTPLTKPAAEHHHSEARSLTGGFVYYGSKYPDLRGAYVYGDYSTGKIWGIRHDGQKVTWHKELADSTLAITAFGPDSHGEILIADHRGEDLGGLYYLDAAPTDVPPSTFPTRLSDSGLFRSVQGHVVEPALISYSVNSPLWSDGAHKERYIALPDGEKKIEMTANRGWNFPDRTVLVKSFALEMEAGNPASRKWIETRFLTRQEGEWVGYSYVWNDEQTDATLVTAAGMDRKFTIRDSHASGGTKTQSWHYPSRTECMVCHSRAANYVLGLTTAQMNKMHEYRQPSGKIVSDNQLRTLESLGVLRLNWANEAKAALRKSLTEKKMTGKQIDAFISKSSATRLQREPQFSSLLTLAPETYESLPNPYDAKADLDARARSYLHSNCAQCHVEAGGGNAQMQLEFKTKLVKANIVHQKPLHHQFEMQDPRLVAPGHPERSVLLHRIANRGAGHMPPLATSVVDREAVDLIRKWIADMPITAALPVEQTVAHRGSSADRPENTLVGFARAIEVGATAVEMDVRTTKDKHLVLSHDADLKRTTNGAGAIADKTLAELKSLDAGSWFDLKYKNERMATLGEALQLCRGKIDVLLDLKEQGDEYARAVAAEVRSQGDPKRTIVGVRSVEQARLFRKLLPEARQIGLMPAATDIDAFVAAGVETIRLWPKWLTDDTLVDKVRKAGVKLHFSGATGLPDEVLPLLKHQPNSISSDNPAQLIKTLTDVQVVEKL